MRFIRCIQKTLLSASSNIEVTFTRERNAFSSFHCIVFVRIHFVTSSRVDKTEKTILLKYLIKI